MTSVEGAHLEEQLACIRYFDLGDLARILTPYTPAVRTVNLLQGAEAGRSSAPIVADVAAVLADVDGKFVRRNHEAFKQKLRGAVSDETVALHLAESKTAISRSTFGRLASQGGSRTAA